MLLHVKLFTPFAAPMNLIFMKFLHQLVCCQVGTDIEDFKCSWLVVKALELCNEEQKKLLHVNMPCFRIHHCFLLFCKKLLIFMFFQEAYGKPDPENVAKVKALYKELDIEVSVTRPHRSRIMNMRS